MLRYVAKVNSISVIDDDGKKYKVIDKKLLEEVQAILNKSESLIEVEQIKLYSLSYEDGQYCIGTKNEVIASHNDWVVESGNFEEDEIKEALAKTLQDLEEHWTVEQIYAFNMEED